LFPLSAGRRDGVERSPTLHSIPAGKRRWGEGSGRRRSGGSAARFKMEGALLNNRGNIIWTQFIAKEKATWKKHGELPPAVYPFVTDDFKVDPMGGELPPNRPPPRMSLRPHVSALEESVKFKNENGVKIDRKGNVVVKHVVREEAVEAARQHRKKKLAFRVDQLQVKLKILEEENRAKEKEMKLLKEQKRRHDKGTESTLYLPYA